MAQMHTLDAFLNPRPAPLGSPWRQVVFEMATDEPELADDEDEDEEDDEDDADDEDEEDGDEDEDEDDEDEDEDDEDEDGAEARTTRGQLKRQNGHRRGGILNG